jgi:hypothetical protein
MYALAEIALLDEGVWPHCFDQVLLGNNFSPALNQHEESIQSFGRKLNQLPPSQEQTSREVNPITIEFP